MNRHARVLALLLCLAGVFSGPSAGATNIIPTKHNLSSTGPGDIKAPPGGEERICVFCHTPHNASPLTPLWNKNIQGVNYDAAAYPPYTSTTMVSKILTGPTGASRLCLSCHDGTIALGAVLLPTAPIMLENTAGGYIPSRSRIGRALTNHHPISFSYYDAASNPEINPSPPLSTLLFYSNAVIQCTTCHDPHDNGNKKFLAVNNVNSALCLLCHTMSGWDTASHSTSPDTWNGLSTNPWPRTGTIGPWDFGWTTVQQNGCENCHAPHSAGGQKRLLNYRDEEKNCFACHNGNVAAKNVQAQFQRPSRHMVEATTIGVTPNHHEEGESPAMLTGHVECVDCHNSHVANDRSPAVPPAVSGKLQKVSGVDSNGVSIAPPNYAVNEYEICFKCHAGPNAQTLFPPIPRVAKDVNTRLAFQTINPSYHPVIAMGKNLDVPSIPSAYEPSLTATSLIYCTDCHDSDDSSSVGGIGARGAHGSTYSPLIRERYLTTDNTLESPNVYALCYRCHNRTSILNDESFRKNNSGKGGHNGHIISNPSGTVAVNAPCSACHDPHGVRDDNMQSGSHTHLINFDTRYVNALPGSGYAYPVFTDNGTPRSGSCTLVCHGVSHDGSLKYSYGGGGGVRIRW